ncbi:MAG: hypothetical protein R6U61_02820, partial [Thermoplasmata archaeon]
MKSDTRRSLVQRLYVSLIVLQLFISIFVNVYAGGPIDLEGDSELRQQTEYFRAGNGTVNKTFYLHDDGAYNSTDNWDILNTTLPMNVTNTDYDNGGYNGTVINKKNAANDDNKFQCWNVTLNLAGDFRIKGDVVIDIWIRADNNPAFSFNMSANLTDSNDTLIGRSYYENTTWPSQWTQITFTIPHVDYNVSKGNYFYLRISRTDTRPQSTYIMYDNYTCPSRITIPTTTYVNVSDTSYHDTTDSLRDPPVFSAGEDVTIKANVTDPIG